MQGLKKSYDYKKVLKALKKGACTLHASLSRATQLHVPDVSLPCAEFCCNGTVVDDPELGQVRTTGVGSLFAGNSLPCV